MFDIGFSEVFVIAIVALIVLGPERLPKAARFAGLWVRRARAQWYSVKSELENELADEELKRSLRQAQADLRDAQNQLRDSGQAIRNEVDEMNRRIAAPVAVAAVAADAAATPEPVYGSGDPLHPSADEPGGAASGESAPGESAPGESAQRVSTQGEPAYREHSPEASVRPVAPAIDAPPTHDYQHDYGGPAQPDYRSDHQPDHQPDHRPASPPTPASDADERR